jgi:hypothetical protein
LREVFSHFGDFLPVARYQVEVRNDIQKMDHRVYEIAKASFGMSDKLHSLTTNVVGVGIHNHVKYNGIGKIYFASESGCTWKKRDK